MCLSDLPREHPKHPYQVSFFYRGRYIDTTYVSASSRRRAIAAGIEWNKPSLKRRKLPFDKVVAGVMMPIENNRYWDYANTANPEGLKLEEYLEKEGQRALSTDWL